MLTATLPKIGKMIGHGAECDVYETEDDNVVCKLYPYEEVPDDYDTVIEIVRLNRKYAELGLAPQVYSDVMEIDSQFGYYVERIIPESALKYEDYEEHLDKLAAVLDVDHLAELSHNWGLTKDRRPVLFDFCPYTIKLLGLE